MTGGPQPRHGDHHAAAGLRHALTRAPVPRVRDTDVTRSKNPQAANRHHHQRKTRLVPLDNFFLRWCRLAHGGPGSDVVQVCPISPIPPVCLMRLPRCGRRTGGCGRRTSGCGCCWRARTRRSRTWRSGSRGLNGWSRGTRGTPGWRRVPMICRGRRRRREAGRGGNRKPGKQPGAPGAHLEWNEHPDGAPCVPGGDCGCGEPRRRPRPGRPVLPPGHRPARGDRGHLSTTGTSGMRLRPGARRGRPAGAPGSRAPYLRAELPGLVRVLDGHAPRPRRALRGRPASMSGIRPSDGWVHALLARAAKRSRRRTRPSGR